MYVYIYIYRERDQHIMINTTYINDNITTSNNNTTNQL